MTWCVIVNERAGRRRTTAADVASALVGINHSLKTTRNTSEARTAIDQAVAEGMTQFCVVGGDGSIHVAVNALLHHPWETPPLVATIPTGSGGDFIRTFALDRGMPEAVGRMKRADAYLIDVGRVDGQFGRRFFVNVLDVGVAAAATKMAERLGRRIGPMRYPAGFWLTLPGFRPAPVSVTTARRTIEESALNVVVANGQFFGGGMNIAPQAAISDGLLDLEVFSGPRRRAFSVMPRVIRGLHLRHPAVTTTRSDRFEIEVPQHWPVEADGELIGHGSVVVDAVPAAIRLAI